MCDCEEMEFEDFEVMLTALSRKSPLPSETAPTPVPQVIVAKQHK